MCDHVSDSCKFSITALPHVEGLNPVMHLVIISNEA